jgi:hypothetical protein
VIALLHISDLHIAETPIWFGSQRPWLGRFHLGGHDEGIADALSIWWRIHRRLYSSMRIVITGDLTRTGSGRAFGCAHRFIHASWLMPQPQFSLLTGLGPRGDQALTVPGNHDFWIGLAANPRVPQSSLDAHFWPLPWVHPILDQSPSNRPGGLEVHLIGFDSCSGLWSFSFKQMMARGAIDPRHFTVAKRRLEEEASEAQKRGNLVLRVALIHHPLANLTPDSRKKLEDWLCDNDVHIILSGHTHDPDPKPPAQRNPPFELCCGTTLQGGGSNHFYLHTVKLDSFLRDQITWETREWKYRGRGWQPLQGSIVWNRNLNALTP